MASTHLLQSSSNRPSPLKSLNPHFPPPKRPPSLRSSSLIRVNSAAAAPPSTTARLSLRTHKQSVLTFGRTRSLTLRRLKPPPSSTTVHMAYQPIPASDRLISAVAYFLPFLNGLSYGYELFAALPALEAAFDPIVPLLSFYKSIPYHTFIGFFVLYVGIVRDRKFSRYVRFNSLQALMLDVVAVVPSLLQVVVGYGEGFGFQLVRLCSSVIFVVVVVGFVYNFVGCVFGRRPCLPYVSGVVDWQLSLFDRMF